MPSISLHTSFAATMHVSQRINQPVSELSEDGVLSFLGHNSCAKMRYPWDPAHGNM